MQRFNVNSSIHFYLFFSLVLIACAHTARVFIPDSLKLSRRENLPNVPEKEVPSEVASLFSAGALQRYEQAKNQGMAVEDVVKAQLRQEEDVLWQEIMTDTGINHQEVCELKEELKEYYRGDGTSQSLNAPHVSSLSRDLARETMKDFDVDPNTLFLQAGDNTLIKGTILVLNEDELLSVSPQVAKAIIGHELIHYQLDDCFIHHSLRLLLKDKGREVPKHDYDHPFYKLRRFQEMRADILPALKNLEYGQASVRCLEIMLEKGDGGFLSHPKTSYRLTVIKEIVDALQLEAMINV